MPRLTARQPFRLGVTITQAYRGKLLMSSISLGAHFRATTRHIHLSKNLASCLISPKADSIDARTLRVAISSGRGRRDSKRAEQCNRS